MKTEDYIKRRELEKRATESRGPTLTFVQSMIIGIMLFGVILFILTEVLIK